MTAVPVPVLPAELWLSIVLSPCLTTADYRALVLVSSYLYDIVTPVLYSNIRISFDEETCQQPHQQQQQYSSSEDASIRDAFPFLSLPLQRLLGRLHTSERLRGYLRHFELNRLQEYDYRLSRKPVHPEEFRLVGFILSIIALCQNLRSLQLTRIQISISHLYHLVTRLRTNLSLKLHGCIVSGEPKLGDTYHVESLECSGWNVRVLYPVMFSPSLTRLSITGDTYGWLQHSLDSYSPSAPISLPNLQVLHIKILNDEIMQFFHLTPSVIELQIRDIARDYTPPIPWPSVLPKLASYHGPSRLIPGLVKGRAVHDLSSWHRDWNNMINLSDLGDYFGSTSPVSVVRWSHSFSLAEFLDYLCDHNREVEELSFVGTVHYLTKDRILPYIAKIKRLKHLRTLLCPGLLSQPMDARKIEDQRVDELKWEREQCESIQKDGCPHIKTISFTGFTTWNHRGEDGWIPRFQCHV